MERIINIDEFKTESDFELTSDREQNFTHIFNLYYKRVYNYTYYRVNNQEYAEDLTSIIFEKVMNKINTYSNDKSKFEVWMFAIAKNAVNDYFRRQKKYKLISLDSIFNMISKEKGPEDIMINKETNSKLFNAVEKLNADDKNIIAYKFGAELKNTEIAKILNISESNVGVRLHRIMKKLKVNLEREV